jgi:hypothetical protein
MKAYSVSRSLAPLILNLSTRWGWMGTIMPLLINPQERTLVPTEQEGGSQIPFGHFGENYLGAARIWTRDCPANRIVTRMTTLSQLKSSVILFKLPTFNIHPFRSEFFLSFPAIWSEDFYAFYLLGCCTGFRAFLCYHRAYRRIDKKIKTEMKREGEKRVNSESVRICTYASFSLSMSTGM